MNAQIKLLEIWKAVNLENYPLKINKKVSNESTSVTWSSTQGKLIEIVYFFLFLWVRHLRLGQWRDDPVVG